MAGVSVQAIRHYETMDLISPSAVDYKNGYRYFSEDTIGDIWRISVLQSAGFSLKEIQDMSELEPGDTASILLEQRAKLKEKLTREQIALQYIDKQISALKKYSQGTEQQGRYKTFEDRFGQTIVTTDGRSLLEHFEKLKSLKGSLGLNPDMVNQASRQLNISPQGNAELLQLFSINHDSRKRNRGDDIQKSGLYYCRTIIGRENLSVFYKQMIRRIQEDGHTLRGDAIEILLIDGNLTRNSDGLVREVQIAIC